MRHVIFFVGCVWALTGQAQDGAARLGVLFDQVDSNRDGSVSEAELKSADRRSAWFSKADLNKDGLVNRDEFHQFLQRSLPRAGEQKSEGIEIVQTTELEGVAPVTITGIKAAAKYSAEREGHSFLVMFKGKTVHESYANGWDKAAGHRLASGTKSFSGALLALAVKDELLTLDELVSETITEWQADEYLSQVTIRQLLSLTSGIDPGANGRVPSFEDSISVSAVSQAGELFRYGPNAFQIFGELIKRKLASRDDLSYEDPLAYLEAGVFDSIGLTYIQWRRDADGNPHLPSGAFITAPNWAKFGQLLLQRGVWEGESLIDEQTLSEAISPQNDVTSKYGLTFWLMENRSGEERPWIEGAYMAAGAGKQRLFVLPAVDMVVVRQGESRQFEDLVFLEALFSLESQSGSVEDAE